MLTLKVSTEQGRDYAFQQAGNDDTVKFSAQLASPIRPLRPLRPNRHLPLKPSLASLKTDAGLPSAMLEASPSDHHDRQSFDPSAAGHLPLGQPSLASASTLSAISPFQEFSSSSSSSSSYFVSNNVESYDSSSNIPGLNRQDSSASAHYEQLRRRGPAMFSDAPRGSTYTTISSGSDWEREHEEAVPNSQSGVFDLEVELEQKFAHLGIAGHASSLAQDSANLLELPENAVIASPSPTSPGFGLGITSDDAIHPDNPSQPLPVFGSPTVQYASEGSTTVEASATPSATPPHSASSRWGTTRPYLRRNTASSVGRSVSRVPSNQSLRLGQQSSAALASTGTGLESESADPGRQQLQPLLGQSGKHGLPKQSRRRSPSFSAFSTSSNGHAALATLSYAEASTSCTRAGHSRSTSVSTVFTSYEEHDTEELAPSSHLSDLRKRPAREAARLPGQAMALVENGQSSIIAFKTEQSPDDLATLRSRFGSVNLQKFSTDTRLDSTHLILSGLSQPFQLHNLLTSELHLFAHSLVVLDIS